MKKLALIGLAVCMVFMFTVPAMALDVDFSGFYRVRGFCVHDYETFGKYEAEHADDHFDMLLDVNIVFKVHPKLKLVTNFTALDKIWGTQDVGPGMGEDTRNIDWNQAYMEFVTGIGVFRVGRMTGGAYQHAFLNTTYDTDRIMYIMLPGTMGGPKWNPILFVYVYEKNVERDFGNSLSDEDSDYHLFVTDYISSNFTIGHLFAFIRDEANSGFGESTQDVYFTNPYLKVKLGPVTLEGEARYTWGYLSDISIPGPDGDDLEVESWSYFAQATFDGGPFDVYIGWAHTDGDADGTMNFGGDTSNAQNGQMGDDWDLLFFLTSDEGMHAQNFGGLGNWSADGNNPYGMDLLYIGGGFDITPTINISGIWGLANADAVPVGSKNIGQEFNLWLTWQIMDGLQYKFLFAFFDADDFWEDLAKYPANGVYPYSTAADDGSAWALFHQLTLSF
jgi:hypothetical protein